MTSSLVGSEMCIRDREKGIPHPDAGAIPQPPSKPAQEGLTPKGKGADGPVSYTHLTLPTICSV
eukprot:4541115-Prorocentrum_lima.AAC.1